ncbi:hypothetical protein [Polaromonas sp. A23]|uniref:hypothetical protein n=1 Tax=Polaromonas sp. A23 TaxID=1944133 RepID=UPI0011154934|nr:hypothetical protein [Polaromonas sp. A23]
MSQEFKAMRLPTTTDDTCFIPAWPKPAACLLGQLLALAAALLVAPESQLRRRVMQAGDAGAIKLIAACARPIWAEGRKGLDF